jgi:LuxR family maltose regulon positive regulatory protein
LHTRASQWYEDNGLVTEAIHHALAAENFKRAASLIELAWRAMDRSLQFATWLGWVKALPDELVRARPVLSVAYAWALLDGGELETGEARLRDAERWLETTAHPGELPESPSAEMVVSDEEEFRSLPVTIASARAYISQARGDVSGTIKHASRALDLLPEDDHLGRAIPAALLGLAYWARGDLEAAHRTLADAMVGFQMTGNIVAAISGTYGLADIRIDQSRLREAVRTYERSLQLVKEQGEPVLQGTADLYLGLSGLHLEQGDLGAAEQYLLKSEELGEHASLPDWPYRRCIAKARIEKALGRLDYSLDLLEEAERLYFRSPVPDVRPVTALKARAWLEQGRLPEAMDWTREQGLSVHDELSYLREFEHITLARVRLAEYKSDRKDRSILEAMGLLERLLKAAEEGGRLRSVIEILLLQALAHEAQDNVPAALTPLARGLALAKPEGYVQTFVDEGTPMARLLYEALSQGVEPEYVRRLLAAFPVAETEQETPSRLRGSRSELVEPLSERELEVLELIAEGLTNQEVATRLYLSLHTVKVHVRNIFAKLAVKNRAQAVAKGRALGLFSQT